MANQVVELECPGCGAAISIGTKQCPYCFRDIVISTFNSVSSMTNLELNKYAGVYRKALSEQPDNRELNKSIAFCYLKLKMYEKALPYFEKVIEDNFDDSEIYFYTAICLLKGKRPFLLQKAVIDKIIEYLDAAAMIEPKGIYYYYLAYVKYDFYEMKMLNTNPNFQDVYQQAREVGLSETDISELYNILGTERPACL